MAKIVHPDELVPISKGSIFHVKRSAVAKFAARKGVEYAERLKHPTVDFYNSEGEYLAYGDARHFGANTIIV